MFSKYKDIISLVCVMHCVTNKISAKVNRKDAETIFEIYSSSTRKATEMSH